MEENVQALYVEKKKAKIMFKKKKCGTDGKKTVVSVFEKKRKKKKVDGFVM